VLDSDDYLLDLADVSCPAVLDRKSKLREWLLSATEERGFSPAEAATAREKLAELDN
jgi:hypothetical protein